MDFVVDSQTGKILAQLPRTPSMAAVQEQATDGLQKMRAIQVEIKNGKKLLTDSALNIQTFDFKFGDPVVDKTDLPGLPISNPPAPWSPAGVSAQANAVAVSQFLRTVLRRNNIDNKGGSMNSSINCVWQRQSPGGNQWLNAFWNGKQMVYGQRKVGAGFKSLSVDLDVVGHEMFHGVTSSTARLEYVAQSGALNESYSDIFGLIIANFDNPDISSWNWKIGEGLNANGKPFRDMQNPSLYNQPDNMKGYVNSSLDEAGDWGGVHTNSGIHNKAAYNILTAKDSSGKFIFKAADVAAIFYLALTQQLSRTSQFIDSRRGVITSAQTYFRVLSEAQITEKIKAIEAAFAAVGIN
jgi:Zn-dependent metalloprotease